jgi:hypothetical protein
MKFPFIKSEMQMMLKLPYHPGERRIGEPIAASVPSHI